MAGTSSFTGHHDRCPLTVAIDGGLCASRRPCRSLRRIRLCSTDVRPTCMARRRPHPTPRRGTGLGVRGLWSLHQHPLNSRCGLPRGSSSSRRILPLLPPNMAEEWPVWCATTGAAAAFCCRDLSSVMVLLAILVAVERMHSISQNT